MEIDKNTNYRKFYERDPKFYMVILEKEDPGERGHEFKMHIFKLEESQTEFNREFELEILNVLSSYDAVDVRISTMKDSNDRLRVTFKIKTKEKAI